MSVSMRTTVDDDGSLLHIIEFSDMGDTEDHGPDTVSLRFGVDEQRIQCRGYDGEDRVYQSAFERRDISFEPISVIGRGETNDLQGVSAPTDEQFPAVPDTIALALNRVGMTVVPNGRWWLDDV